MQYSNIFEESTRRIQYGGAEFDLKYAKPAVGEAYDAIHPDIRIASAARAAFNAARD